MSRQPYDEIADRSKCVNLMIALPHPRLCRGVCACPHASALHPDIFPYLNMNRQAMCMRGGARRRQRSAAPFMRLDAQPKPTVVHHQLDSCRLGKSVARCWELNVGAGKPTWPSGHGSCPTDRRFSRDTRVLRGVASICPHCAGFSSFLFIAIRMPFP